MRVVALADMHVGSRVALADPRDGEVPRGDMGAPERRRLWRLWRDATSGRWGGWSAPDVLIVVGDLIEGQNRRQGGTGNWTNELLVQCQHAAGLLRMWHAKRIIIVRGSGYHVEVGGSGMQAEEYIARLVGAEPNPRHKHMPTFHAQHKIPVSRVFHYRTTPLAREMLYAELHGKVGRSRRTNIVLRAHAHYYVHVEYGSSQGFNLPCWKALDDFLELNSPLAINPRMGFVGFEVTNGKVRTETRLAARDAVQAPPHIVLNDDPADADHKDRRGKAQARATRRAGTRGKASAAAAGKA